MGQSWSSGNSEQYMYGGGRHSAPSPEISTHGSLSSGGWCIQIYLLIDHSPQEEAVSKDIYSLITLLRRMMYPEISTHCSLSSGGRCIQRYLLMVHSPQEDDVSRDIYSSLSSGGECIQRYCRAPRPVPSCLVPYLSLTHPLPIPYPSFTRPIPV